METQSMTIAEKNAENVKRGYAAFNSADMATLTQLFHKDASWQTPGKSSIAGTFHGRDNVFGHFGRYGMETNGTMQSRLMAVSATTDGKVVAIHHNSGTRNGKTLNTDCCIEFDFKDGLLISGREYFFDLYNWDEFWS